MENQRRFALPVAIATIAALLSASLISATLLVSCFQYSSLTETTDSGASDAETAADSALDDTDTDTTVTDADATITFDGQTITVTGTGAAVEGSAVTIYQAGRYALSGTLTDGQVIVNDTVDSDTVKLILSGTAIACTTSAPLYIEQAEKVVITLADGTDNSLSGGLSSTATPDAALWSAEDLTINGEGALTVTSNGVGIRSKDGLKIAGGTISVTSAADGIKGRDFVYASAGTVTVTSAGDGIAAYYGSDDTDEADDTRGYILIEGGTFTVTSGGGSQATLGSDASAKALKAVSSLDISGGSFTLDSADDAIHCDAGGSISGGNFAISANSSNGQGIKFGDAASFSISGASTIDIASSYEGVAGYNLAIGGSATVSIMASNDGISMSAGTTVGGTESSDGSSLVITGSTVYVHNATGDAVDSNGTLTVSGGALIVSAATASPEVGIDVNGNFSITGGTVIAAARYDSSMTKAPTAATTTQAAVLVALGASQSAGTLFHIQDASGTDIVTFKSAYAFQSVIFSSAALKTGTTYSIYYGGSSTGTVDAYGVYLGGTYTAGTLYKTASLSSTVTTLTSGTSSTTGGGTTTGGTGVPGGGTGGPTR